MAVLRHRALNLHGREVHLLTAHGTATPAALLRDVPLRLLGPPLLLLQSIDALSSVERELMERKLEELEGCLQPGFTILNWNSLGIAEFAAACNKAIATFQQLVKQVQKNSGIIEQVVYAIAGAQLVSEAEEGECRVRREDLARPNEARDISSLRKQGLLFLLLQ